MLVNVGLTPEAVTSPGGFGGRTLEFYAKVAGEAVRAVTGNPLLIFSNASKRGLRWRPRCGARTGNRARLRVRLSPVATTRPVRGPVMGRWRVLSVKDNKVELDLPVCAL